jgi:Flp pilus assembly protein TadD
MSTQTARSTGLPKGLVVAVLTLTITVLALGGAVVVIKLRPEPLPTNAIDRTLVQWQRAVDDSPNNAGAHTGLGLALLQAGRTDDAQAEFEEAIRLDGETWMALYQLGLLERTENPERALLLLAKSAKFAPDTSKTPALVEQGTLLMQAGDLKGAKIAFQRAVVDSPFIIEGHMGLAQVLEQLGSTEDALREYQEVLRFDPTNPTATEAVARLKNRD